MHMVFIKLKNPLSMKSPACLIPHPITFANQQACVITISQHLMPPIYFYWSA